ncbi:MAG: hypothetical protein ACXVAK_18840 [Vulcanimicrobiaceae bacterium]
MTRIDERVHLRCPYVRAREYMHEMLQQVVWESILPQSLQLTATLPVANIELAKDVSVEFAPAADATPGEEGWEVRWTPQAGGIYPSFEGKLTLRPDEDYGFPILELAGEYAPPLGVVGLAFDAAVGHTIASETARHLLAGIASGIVARYRISE